MPPSPTCSALDPLQSGFVPWSSLYPVDKVPVPTRLDLEATTLLKMLKTLKMVLNPLQTMEKPYMGWRSINDRFCGHSCSDGVMVPQEKVLQPHRWCHDGSWPIEVLLVWVRWLKKPMNPLASWRSLEEALGPTLDGLKVNSSCTLDEDDVVIDKDLEPLMKTLMPLQRSWSPLLVWWHDEGTHTHVMTLGHLLACYGLMWCL